MLLRRIETAPGSAPVGVGPELQFSLERQVQNALNVFLPLKNPRQMPALMALLKAASEEVDEALASLHYVHFARFLPSLDGAMLMVITAYDGGLRSYIMDFVAVLGDPFNQILQFIADAPPLPVQRYASEFTDYIIERNLSQIGVWSAYPDNTVIDILARAKRP